MGKELNMIKLPLQINRYDGNERIICHLIKERNKNAIIKAAKYIAKLNIIGKDSILVPAPQHTGKPIYTKEIADIVAYFTGATVLDVVKCIPHETLYQQKLKGNINVPKFYLNGNIEVNKDKDVFLIDNVISTGTTFNNINKLFKNTIIPLPYTVDYRTLELQ